MRKNKKVFAATQCMVFGSMAMFFCLFPKLLLAECVKLPESIDFNCKDCIFPGAVWTSSNTVKEYGLGLQWIGEASNQFDIIVADNNLSQVQWPYPLGQGLYLAMTGTFKIIEEKSGEVFTFSITEPTQQFGKSPLATIPLRQAITEGTFRFVKDESRFSVYIMDSGSGEVDGPLTPPPTNLRMYIRSSHTKGEVVRDIGTIPFVCTTSNISVDTPCSIMADPTVITFKDLKATGSNLSRPEDVKHTNVSISCDKNTKREVYLRIFPANPPTDGTNIALFNHVDSGQVFDGLGLIYKLNQKPSSCDGGDKWQESILLGDSGDSNLVTGTIYWGLCRTSERADTGAYTTTAIIRFWVD